MWTNELPAKTLLNVTIFRYLYSENVTPNCIPVIFADRKVRSLVSISRNLLVDSFLFFRDEENGQCTGALSCLLSGQQWCFSFRFSS
ncbi:uncharacterized protein LOC113470700 isoform X5 [Diaphorina citri]|uniref:Uncharacterized protein LOC113470700 isoform X5 n=1 Tax=Diaphorina citri TaxID=121845 RepID=A0A3Q0J9K1_DIACI|nr:uncharacterized protein LOC113470700 isoform X5 [Diaphorina citri]